ncbi:MAG TPA: hypothetical protein VLG11_03055 [Candidatus Saccharimonadales bacterium]|nr:hypothetical protein [Candidatus Saccharimonadales bacterium]
MTQHETSTEPREQTPGRRAIGLGLRAGALALGATLLGTGAFDPSCGANAPKAVNNLSCTSEYDAKNLSFIASVSGDYNINDVRTHFHIEANDAHGIRPAVDATVDKTFVYRLGAFNDELSRKGEIQISHGAAAILVDTVEFVSGSFAGQTVVCTESNVRL